MMNAAVLVLPAMSGVVRRLADGGELDHEDQGLVR